MCNVLRNAPMNAPSFKYHPDPFATGSLVVSNTTCACCAKERGVIYTGPAYAINDYNDRICPWCISDGSAHNVLEVTFTCEWDIGLGAEPVPEAVVEEIAFRTPGFQGWEQSRWWTHCGDGAEFLGRAGRDDLRDFDSTAMAVIRASVGLEKDGAEWDDLLDALSREGTPRAYKFRCRKCEQLGGYADCDRRKRRTMACTRSTA